MWLKRTSSSDLQLPITKWPEHTEGHVAWVLRSLPLTRCDKSTVIFGLAFFSGKPKASSSSELKLWDG